MALGQISMVILLALALADVPVITPLRKPARPQPDFSSKDTVPLFPEVVQAGAQNAEQAATEDAAPRAERMQEKSRLAIQRFVSGEFARAVKSLPSHKKGFRFAPEKPLDEDNLRAALVAGGSSANPGDQVQITKLEFKDKEIVVHINGGAKRKTNWRERVQVSMGGVPSSRVDRGSPGYQATGSTLILDYGRPLPDLSPDDVKKQLGVFLDFSKQRSASVQWIETLPLEVQEAIKEKRAIVGMDREMVQAAMGKPDKKVRERDPDGLETEDWIYGHPPAKTVFVKFAGEKVISVKQFPT